MRRRAAMSKSLSDSCFFGASGARCESAVVLMGSGVRGGVDMLREDLLCARACECPECFFPPSAGATSAGTGTAYFLSLPDMEIFSGAADDVSPKTKKPLRTHKRIRPMFAVATDAETEDRLFKDSRVLSMRIIAGLEKRVSFETAYQKIYYLTVRFQSAFRLESELMTVLTLAATHIHDEQRFLHASMCLQYVFMAFLNSSLWHRRGGSVMPEAVTIWHLNRGRRLWTFVRTVVRVRVILGRLMHTSRHKIARRLGVSGFRALHALSTRPMDSVRHSACPPSYSSSSSGGVSAIVDRKRLREGNIRSFW